MFKNNQYIGNIAEYSRFLFAFLSSPRRVGSIAPSSKYLAQKIRKAIGSQDTNITLVEAGAGTGAITKKIADLEPTIVELDPKLCKVIKSKFPLLDVRQESIQSYLNTLNINIGLVLTIPLQNNPEKESILASIQEQYDKKNIKWCILYTYSTRNPLETISFSVAHRYSLTLANIPPAFIWVYR